MKEFITVFFFSIIVCFVALFFFSAVIFKSIWTTTIVIAFVFAVMIKVFMEQDSRIKQLEEKMEKMQNKR